MKYVSMFSGIEAATVAWHSLGFEPLAFSEIEKFPSAVLAHRWPKVKNLGDMTKVDWEQFRGKADLVVGGPPCQAFSVAGLRGSLNDARGNLSLAYVRAIHAIRPRWCLTENVPGWLNTPDNAFGCFLAGLTGADAPLVSRLDGGGWSGSGLAVGPLYSAAWTTLDAQFFGVPQRRRRVFVVGYLGDWRRAAQVLFEPKGLCGNNPPSRKTGARAAAGAQDGARASGEDGRLDVFTAEGGGDVSLTKSSAGKQGNNQMPVVIDRAAFNSGENAQFDAKIEETETAPTLQARGPCAVAMPFDTTQITSPENRSNPKEGDPSPTLAKSGHPPTVAFNIYPKGGQGADLEASETDVASAVTPTEHEKKTDRGTRVVVPEPIAFTSKDAGQDAGPLAPTLRAGGHDESHQNGGVPPAVVIPIDMRQASRGDKMTNNRPEGSSGGAPGTGVGKDGDPSPTIAASHVPAVVAFQSSQSGVRVDDVHATLDSNNGSRRHNGVIVPETSPVVFKPSHYTRGKDGAPSDITPPLSADADKGDQDPLVFETRFARNGRGAPEPVCPPLKAQSGESGKGDAAPIVAASAVRRLTPRECERLQGFPDDYTLIPYGAHKADCAAILGGISEDLGDDPVERDDAPCNCGKPPKDAADGPRYKALGNSMAKDVMEWLGRRIKLVDSILQEPIK